MLSFTKWRALKMVITNLKSKLVQCNLQQISRVIYTNFVNIGVQFFQKIGVTFNLGDEQYEKCYSEGESVVV